MSTLPNRPNAAVLVIEAAYFIERRGIESYQWLSADELKGRPERASDPDLPRLMRAAVSAVRPERGGQRERI